MHWGCGAIGIILAQPPWIGTLNFFKLKIKSFNSGIPRATCCGQWGPPSASLSLCIHVYLNPGTSGTIYIHINVCLNPGTTGTMKIYIHIYIYIHLSPGTTGTLYMYIYIYALGPWSHWVCLKSVYSVWASLVIWCLASIRKAGLRPAFFFNEQGVWCLCTLSGPRL